MKISGAGPSHVRDEVEVKSLPVDGEAQDEEKLISTPSTSEFKTPARKLKCGTRNTYQKLSEEAALRVQKLKKAIQQQEELHQIRMLAAREELAAASEERAAASEKRAAARARRELEEAKLEKYKRKQSASLCAEDSDSDEF